MFASSGRGDKERMLTLTLLLLAADSDAHVVLPLERYDTLARVRAQDVRSFTIIESAHLEGSLEQGLTLTLAGRARGAMPAVKVLGDEARLLSCISRDSVLGRAATGELELTPLAAKFEVKCAVGRSEAGVALSLMNVSAVDATVRDGVVDLGTPAAAVQRVSVTRRLAPTQTHQPVPTTAVGHYRVTVLPDETRFRWQIQVHNPNREHADFVVPIRPNEHVEAATPQARDVSADAVTFDVAPGDAELVMIGTMKGSEFSPPLQAAAQMVLLESHPLLRLETRSEGSAVSPAETGISAQYRGAQALLLSTGQHVSWVATRLEALPSTGYTVRSALSTFFIGGDGQMVAESSAILSNEGAPALSMALTAKPVWAAMDDTAIALTRDGHGGLYLPLAIGEQKASVQHRQSLEVMPGFAWGRLELPGFGATATRSAVRLRYGRDWVPLFEGYAGDRRWGLPALGEALMLLCLAAWAAQLLCAWLSRRQAVMVAVLLGFVAWSTPTGYWAVLVGLAAVTMLRMVPWLRRLELPLISPSSLAGTVTVMGLGMLLLVGGATLFGDNIKGLFGMSADALAGETQMSSRHAAEPPGSSPVPHYEGTPARVDLPSGQRETFLSQDLVDGTASGSATVLLLRASVITTLKVLLALLLLLAAYRLRGPLLQGARSQLERLTVAVPA